MAKKGDYETAQQIKRIGAKLTESSKSKSRGDGGREIGNDTAKVATLPVKTFGGTKDMTSVDFTGTDGSRTSIIGDGSFVSRGKTTPEGGMMPMTLPETRSAAAEGFKRIKASRYPGRSY